MIRRRPDECEPVFFDHLGEIGVLREKSDTRVYCVGIGDRGGGNDRGDVQVTVFRGGGADTNRLIRKANMHSIRVGS